MAQSVEKLQLKLCKLQIFKAVSTASNSSPKHSYFSSKFSKQALMSTPNFRFTKCCRKIKIVLRELVLNQQISIKCRILRLEQAGAGLLFKCCSKLRTSATP
ncbi:hypothetical protein A4A49_41653 [Nicotiana attenuata]|uniref:Uncharacterized protein n=1 Tax=Nicotiana attenuata TaxID=49451 RepID=A0A1J6KB76_NICAT|nr:hypothetical protein A4A49_41653 [Nicotiana attenuata]